MLNIPIIWDHISLFFFLIFSICLSVLIYELAYFVSTDKISYYTEKISVYECGFDPFNEARETVQIKFYIIAILFILFDLEALFLYPFVIGYSTIFVDYYAYSLSVNTIFYHPFLIFFFDGKHYFQTIYAYSYTIPDYFFFTPLKEFLNDSYKILFLNFPIQNFTNSGLMDEVQHLDKILSLNIKDLTNNVFKLVLNDILLPILTFCWFLFLLFLTFIYELQKGALDWE